MRPGNGPSKAAYDLANPAVVVNLQRHFGVSFAKIRVRLLQDQLLTLAVVRLTMVAVSLDELELGQLGG